MNRYDESGNTNSKVSLIVPVYNTSKKYLVSCIDSILEQTFTDFELIIVDDGSRDECAIFLDEQERRDSRISVYHQNNAGVAVARNFGIEKAKGEFIGFIDSDDTVTPDYLYQSVTLIENYALDIVIGGINEVFSRKIRHNSIKSIEKRGICIFDMRKPKESEILMAISFTRQSSTQFGIEGITAGLGFSGNKLYRASLIKQLIFPAGIKFWEDLVFFIKAIEKAHRIGIVPKIWYNYFMRSSSVSNSCQIALAQDIEPVLSELQTIARAHSPVVMQAYNQYAAFMIFIYIEFSIKHRISMKTVCERIADITANPLIKEALYQMNCDVLRLSLKQRLIIKWGKNGNVLAIFVFLKMHYIAKMLRNFIQGRRTIPLSNE
jgi:glycosyltransferase involved in cell wall biosynthesis